MEERNINHNYRKADIIDAMEELKYTKKEANFIIDDIVKVLTKALANGNSVQLHGFGTFEVGMVAERESVDIQTGERITIPAYKAVKFKPGKVLKRAVKEGFYREEQ